MSHDVSNVGQAASGENQSKLISADRVAGTDVYDHAGERLGEVQSIMIDKISGKVAYVMISFGGVLGIGEKHHPLPWDMLEYDMQCDGYRVDMDLADLEGAPSYDRDGLAGFDSSGGDAVDRHYGGKQRREASEAGSEGQAPLVSRSDLNDGIDRPLGFYSRKAQSLRNGDTTGSDTDPTTGLRADEQAPGFYSPEQQQARSEINNLEDQVRQPDPSLNEIDGRNDAASRT